MAADMNAEREQMEDFFQSYSESHEQCEHALIELEQSLKDPGTLAGLSRTLLGMKSNLIFAGFREITPLLESVENLLEAVQQGALSYDATLSDIILLVLDTTRTWVADRLTGSDLPPSAEHREKVCQLMTRIANSHPSERSQSLHQALTLLDPALALEPPLEPAVAKDTVNTNRTAPAFSDSEDPAAILAFYGVELNADMQFFLSINAPLESRSLFWKGRTARQLNLALAMNREAGKPISAEQLAAAVILHDIGMAFLPVDLLHANKEFSHEALALLHAHPQQGHMLMTSLKRWHEAAQAILQHHERMDGTGYPNRTPGQEICDGAKILAIVDTFEARTHERAHTHMTKRPFIRAVLEIGSCAGTQFDSRWVAHFNLVARTLTSLNKR